MLLYGDVLVERNGKELELSAPDEGHVQQSRKT